MTSCLEDGGRVWLSRSDNPKRKLKYSWEIAEVGGAQIVINTARGNQVVKEGLLQALGGSKLESEVKHGDSRIDFRIDGTRWVEVKSVSLRVGENIGAFPDAPTERGRKHLQELTTIVEKGGQATLFFLISRDDVNTVHPADDVDPKYGDLLRTAMDAGVEVVCWTLNINGRELTLGEQGTVLRRAPSTD
jgi:sugar fermentation stimulation protein A